MTGSIDAKKFFSEKKDILLPDELDDASSQDGEDEYDYPDDDPYLIDYTRSVASRSSMSASTRLSTPSIVGTEPRYTGSQTLNSMATLNEVDVTYPPLAPEPIPVPVEKHIYPLDLEAMMNTTPFKVIIPTSRLTKWSMH